MHTCKHTYAHKTYTQAHKCTHTYKHTYIHTYIRAPPIVGHWGCLCPWESGTLRLWWTATSTAAAAAGLDLYEDFVVPLTEGVTSPVCVCVYVCVCVNVHHVHDSQENRAKILKRRCEGLCVSFSLCVCVCMRQCVACVWQQWLQVANIVCRCCRKMWGALRWLGVCMLVCVWERDREIHRW